MPDTPPTQDDLNRLSKSVDNLNVTIKELRSEMASTYVRKDVLDPQLAGMQAKIDAHQNWLDWATRLVLGAVILAMLALVLATGAKP